MFKLKSSTCHDDDKTYFTRYIESVFKLIFKRSQRYISQGLDDIWNTWDEF